MGKYIITRYKEESFANEISSAEEGWEKLIEAVLIQAYRDYKNGDQQAKYFLETCEIGKKILREEERLYGKRK